MTRVQKTMITGLMFLAYTPIGLMIPWSFAVEDVDLVVTSAQRPSVAEPKKNRTELNRGQFIKTEALVSNLGAGSSGPFEVGIFLSEDPDGHNKVHEFDIIKNVDLSGSEYISISGEYLIPHYISPGRDYWVVVEADYDKNVTEKDEKNKKIIQMINILCDEFTSDYGGDTYVCPKFGEEGGHFND